jgi:hypothetical protein
MAWPTRPGQGGMNSDVFSIRGNFFDRLPPALALRERSLPHGRHRAFRGKALTPQSSQVWRRLMQMSPTSDPFLVSQNNEFCGVGLHAHTRRLDHLLHDLVDGAVSLTLVVVAASVQLRLTEVTRSLVRLAAVLVLQRDIFGALCGKPVLVVLEHSAACIRRRLRAVETEAARRGRMALVGVDGVHVDPLVVDVQASDLASPHYTHYNKNPSTSHAGACPSWGVPQAKCVSAFDPIADLAGRTPQVDFSSPRWAFP